MKNIKESVKQIAKLAEFLDTKKGTSEVVAHLDAAIEKIVKHVTAEMPSPATPGASDESGCTEKNNVGSPCGTEGVKCAGCIKTTGSILESKDNFIKSAVKKSIIRARARNRLALLK